MKHAMAFCFNSPADSSLLSAGCRIGFGPIALTLRMDGPVLVLPILQMTVMYLK